MAGYSFLLVDADDTLMDFPAAEAHALQALFVAHALPTDEATFQRYYAINTALWDALERGEVTSEALRVLRFSRLLEDLHCAKSASILAEDYIALLGQQAHPLPGAEAALARWAARVPIAIVTNGLAAVQRHRFARSPMSPYIRALVISEEVGVAKPDPRIFAAALKALGCTDPTQALMIGDSLKADVAGASQSGIDSCWYNPHHLPHSGPHTPTHIIDTLDAVDALLM